MKLPRLPRLSSITDQSPGELALTLKELILITGEADRGLRQKLSQGRFHGAYRTAGTRGEWRIPLKAVRHYQQPQPPTSQL